MSRSDDDQLNGADVKGKEGGGSAAPYRSSGSMLYRGALWLLWILTAVWSAWILSDLVTRSAPSLQRFSLMPGGGPFTGTEAALAWAGFVLWAGAGQFVAREWNLAAWRALLRARKTWLCLAVASVGVAALLNTAAGRSALPLLALGGAISGLPTGLLAGSAMRLSSVLRRGRTAPE